ncbi:MAG: cupin domain-containing protein [Acidimicrobiales bacterium]
MKPLDVEGGSFKQTYRSSLECSPGRAMATAIYVLFSEEEPVSRMHRLDADEMWHFYLGDPMELHLFEGGSHDEVVLGPDPFAGQRLQMLVPAGTWMGARLAPAGRWALLGCTMSPGFSSSCYEQGDRQELSAGYPELADLIASLTGPRRQDSAPPEA